LSYNELIDLVKHRHERHRRSLTEEVDEELAHLAGPDEDNEHLIHGAMPVDDVFHASEDERYQQKTTRQQQAKGESAAKGSKRHSENDKHTQKEQDSCPRQQEAQSPRQQSQSAAQRRRPLALPQTPKTQSRTVRHPPASSNPLARVLATASPQNPSPPEGRSRGAGLRSQKRKNYAVANPDLPQQITIKLRDLDDALHCKRVRFDPSGTACENIIAQTWGGETSKLVTWYAGEKTIATGTQRAALVAQAAGELPAMPCTYCQANGGVFDECRVNSAWPANGTCASCAYWGHGTKCCSLADGTKTPRKADKPIDKAMAKFEAEINDVSTGQWVTRIQPSSAPNVSWSSNTSTPTTRCTLRSTNEETAFARTCTASPRSATQWRYCPSLWKLKRQTRMTMTTKDSLARTATDLAATVKRRLRKPRVVASAPSFTLAMTTKKSKMRMGD
ncbi:hypothetical protein KEM55_003353, partial [Ascosphaera atra]